MRIKQLSDEEKREKEVLKNKIFFTVLQGVLSNPVFIDRFMQRAKIESDYYNALSSSVFDITDYICNEIDYRKRTKFRRKEQ